MAGLWDKKFRKRNISIVLCMGLFAGCLSGCGGEYAGVTGGDAASGGAVSGSAISGSAISDKDMDGKAVSGSAIGKEQAGDGSGEEMEQDMSGHRFCTDTDLYYKENGAVMQMRLDGTHKTCLTDPDTKYLEKYLLIDYVDKDWLYYEVWEENEDSVVLYRAPIRKDADGYDVVSISEKEEIVKDKDIYSTYVDSRYLFYINDDEELVKYDLQKRRKVSTKEIEGDSLEVFKVNNHYIAATDDGEILTQDIDGKQWTRVSGFAADDDNDRGIDDYVTQSEQAVFYPQYLNEDEDDMPFRIRRYDGDKETDFLTWKQIEKTVSKAEGLASGELDFAIPDWLFWQGDRLYIQVQAGWVKDGVYHEEFMMLSQGEEEDGSGLRYEREFTECMRSHVKTRKGKWVDRENEPGTLLVDHMVVNSARCIAMVNGKAYLSLFDDKKDEGHLGCYELSTGKFQWVEREDRLFYEIGYDYNLSELETVYNERFENDFAVYCLTPSADKGGYGYFVEDAEE